MSQIKKITANMWTYKFLHYFWNIYIITKFVRLWKTRVDISQKPLLALIDRLFICLHIYTNTNSQYHFVHGHLNNVWHKKAHFGIGKPCLMRVASNNFMEKMLTIFTLIDWFPLFYLHFLIFYSNCLYLSQYYSINCL